AQIFGNGQTQVNLTQCLAGLTQYLSSSNGAVQNSCPSTNSGMANYCQTGSMSCFPPTCQALVGLITPAGHAPAIRLDGTDCNPGISGTFANWVQNSLTFYNSNFGPAYNYKQCLDKLQSSTTNPNTVNGLNCDAMNTPECTTMLGRSLTGQTAPSSTNVYTPSGGTPVCIGGTGNPFCFGSSPSCLGGGSPGCSGGGTISCQGGQAVCLGASQTIDTAQLSASQTLPVGSGIAQCTIGQPKCVGNIAQCIPGSLIGNNMLKCSNGATPACDALGQVTCSGGSTKTDCTAFEQWVQNSYNLAQQEQPKFEKRYLFLKDIYNRAITMQHIFPEISTALNSFYKTAWPLLQKAAGDAASMGGIIPHSIIYGWYDTLPGGGRGHGHLVKATIYAPGASPQNPMIQNKMPWVSTDSGFMSRTFTLRQRDGYVYAKIQR
ncbi:MAG: hypothetical protein HQL13_02555, partial [Candidatus Omnitrophica bacterium]|nr:hypothetical protein [Candidatus Omnitrophota bacterium]